MKCRNQIRALVEKLGRNKILQDLVKIIQIWQLEVPGQYLSKRQLLGKSWNVSRENYSLKQIKVNHNKLIRIKKCQIVRATNNKQSCHLETI